ncbi:MAG: 2-oxoacid:acceptor oxidoreductase family protein [Acidimicrobiales bacterium]|jgi:2-oxoglutarate ferredoxin oxidoreductase subunit gamma|nr:2-oxoacid:acceptor oxidoreductase family protein [Actinomycetota bacterium]
MWRIAMRLAGEGGQGVGLAAAVLAEAALASGYEVTMLQTYGPEARGGASSADVVISDRPVANPKVNEADLLLLLNQTSWSKFGCPPWRTPTTVVVVEEGRVPLEGATSGVLALPFERLARDELREKVAANMLAVGAVGALIGCLASSSLVEAGLGRSPAAFRVVNQEAIERGWHLVAQSTELGGLRAMLAGTGAPVLDGIDGPTLVTTP